MKTVVRNIILLPFTAQKDLIWASGRNIFFPWRGLECKEKPMMITPIHPFIMHKLGSFLVCFSSGMWLPMQTRPFGQISFIHCAWNSRKKDRMSFLIFSAVSSRLEKLYWAFYSIMYQSSFPIESSRILLRRAAAESWKSIQSILCQNSFLSSEDTLWKRQVKAQHRKGGSGDMLRSPFAYTFCF